MKTGLTDNIQNIEAAITAVDKTNSLSVLGETLCKKNIETAQHVFTGQYIPYLHLINIEITDKISKTTSKQTLEHYVDNLYLNSVMTVGQFFT